MSFQMPLPFGSEDQGDEDDYAPGDMRPGTPAPVVVLALPDEPPPRRNLLGRITGRTT